MRRILALSVGLCLMAGSFAMAAGTQPQTQRPHINRRIAKAIRAGRIDLKTYDRVVRGLSAGDEATIELVNNFGSGHINLHAFVEGISNLSPIYQTQDTYNCAWDCQYKAAWYEMGCIAGGGGVDRCAEMADAFYCTCLWNLCKIGGLCF